MVVKNHPVVSRLEELTNKPIGLVILILGSKSFKMETLGLSKYHKDNEIIFYKDGIEVIHKPHADGSSYGQIYVSSLNAIITYSEPSQKNL